MKRHGLRIASPFKNTNAYTYKPMRVLFILQYYKCSQPLGWTLQAGRRRRDGKHLRSAVQRKKQRFCVIFYISYLYSEFKQCLALQKQSFLTVMLVRLLPRIWTTVFPVDASTQDSAPYSILTAIDGGSRWTRWTIGLLAQPRDSHKALKPTSPLRGRDNYIYSFFCIFRRRHL